MGPARCDLSLAESVGVFVGNAVWPEHRPDHEARQRSVTKISSLSLAIGRQRAGAWAVGRSVAVMRFSLESRGATQLRCALASVPVKSRPFAAHQLRAPGVGLAKEVDIHEAPDDPLSSRSAISRRSDDLGIRGITREFKEARPSNTPAA